MAQSEGPDRSGEGRQGTSGIGRIYVASAGEVMADNLRSLILSGAMEAGALLPSERDLAEESGLSRASVREALKALTVEGLVAVKTGRNGGYSVQEPPRESVVRSLDSFIRGRRITRSSLLEAREIIEPMCAALAAERAGAAGLDRLRALTASMAAETSDVPTFIEHNIDWHVAVAEASKNEILVSVMTAISHNIRLAMNAEEYRSVQHMHEAQHLHERVLLAIEEGDAEAAFRRMHRHLTAASELSSHGAVVALPDIDRTTTAKGMVHRT